MGGPLACRRCGAPPAGYDAFCSRCGAPRRALRWVAFSPVAASPRPPRRLPYTGPPRYRFVPRWGFPPLPWRPPEPAVPARPGPLYAARALAGTAVPLLWAAASVAVVAAGAEIWRYVLLLASRGDALPAGTVAASDALVVAAGTVAPLLALTAGVPLIAWSVRASQAAADRAGVLPTRSVRAIVLGWLVPGPNLVVPGGVLAEIEHCALDRPPAQRPRPSRLLRWWWALWVVDLLLCAFVLLWSLRTGVQARADGVEQHALLDVLAAATAAVTAVLVTRLTRWLAPPRPVRREVLVAVGGPPTGRYRSGHHGQEDTHA